jgi:hypothetical protein
MIDNFDNIGKTFKILSKTLSKEYPYLSNIELDSVSENVGQIYVHIDVNYNEFLEYNDIDVRTSLRDYFIRYLDSDDAGDILNGKILYLSSYLDNLDRFGYKFNNQVEEYLNGMVEMLPEQLIPKYEFEGAFGETDNYTCNLKISEFILSFDLDRYIKYIN